MPDPAVLWRGPTDRLPPKQPLALPPDEAALQDKLKQALLHPEIRQYPLVDHQGDTPVHLVTQPLPAQAYQPVPVQRTDGVHLIPGEMITVDSQGQNRNLSNVVPGRISLEAFKTPQSLWASVWEITRNSLRWVTWNYVDFYQQLQSWDGTVGGLLRHAQLWWRAAVVGLITFGIVEVGTLLEALAMWGRLLYDILRSTLGLVGTLLDDLWMLVSAVVNTVTSWFI